MSIAFAPDALIAAHIARHGVTRCPAAIVAPSTATLSPEDEAAHRARTERPESDWNFGWQPRPQGRKGGVAVNAR